MKKIIIPILFFLFLASVALGADSILTNIMPKNTTGGLIGNATHNYTFTGEYKGGNFNGTFRNSTGDLKWINPENVNDIDKENIEGDMNTFVDIGGDTMQGNLDMNGYTLLNYLITEAEALWNGNYTSVWNNINNLLSSNTSTNSRIDSLNNSKLDLTDQRYNDTASSKSYVDSNFYNQSTSDARYLNGALVYYFYNESSDVVPAYTVMNATLPQTDTLKISVFNSIADGTQLFGRINKNSNLSTIEAGIWSEYTHVQITAGTNTLQLRSEILVRTAGGVETSISNSSTSSAVPNDAMMHQMIWFGQIPQKTFLNKTDMVVMKLYAVVTGAGTNPSFEIHTEGTTGASIILPVNPQSITVTVTETDPVALLNISNNDAAWRTTKNDSYYLLNTPFSGKNFSFGTINQSHLVPNLGLTFANLTNFNLNQVWSGVLGFGNLTAFNLNQAWTGVLGWGNLTGYNLNVNWIGTLFGGNISAGSITATQLTSNIGLKGGNITDITNSSLAGTFKLGCGNITQNAGGGDTDFCNDATGTGSGGNVTSIAFSVVGQTTTLRLNNSDNSSITAQFTDQTSASAAVAPLYNVPPIVNHFYGDTIDARSAILGTEAISIADLGVFGVYSYSTPATINADAGESFGAVTTTNTALYNASKFYRFERLLNITTGDNAMAIGIFRTGVNAQMFKNITDFNGIFFYYNTTGTSGNWNATTCSSLPFSCTRINTDVGFKGNVTKYWNFTIVSNGLGSYATFYINSTQVANITTTMPLTVNSSWVGTYMEANRAVVQSFKIDYGYYEPAW